MILRVCSYKMKKETDAEQGWFSDYSDSTFDGDEYDSELDEEYIDEISEDWYDYDEEHYEEDDDWHEYLFRLMYWDTDDESDESEVEE